VDLLLLGLVAGLAAVERKGFMQAMLSRPIALAPLVGLALGDVAGGLAVGAPLELLWLGAVNLGAALPVHEALATAAVAGGAVLAGRDLGGGVTPPVALLATLACVPVALLGRRADQLVEARNELLARRAEEALRRHEARRAARTNLLGLAAPFAFAAALAPPAAALCSLAVPAVLRAAPGAAVPLGIGWWAFCGLTCAAGAAALRARRAGWAFGAAALAALLVGLAARGLA
jgi:PTS system mannose-specific IIC component